MNKDNELIWEQYSKSSDGQIFDYPYTNGRGGAPRPEFLEHSNYQGSVYVQRFGPEQARGPVKYPNHNPLGAKLEPGEYYEVTLNWDLYGAYYPQTETSPAEEPEVINVKVELIKNEDDVELQENEPAHQAIVSLIVDTFDNSGVSDLEVYGWEADYE